MGHHRTIERLGGVIQMPKSTSLLVKTTCTSTDLRKMGLFLGLQGPKVSLDMLTHTKFQNSVVNKHLLFLDKKDSSRDDKTAHGR